MPAVTDSYPVLHSPKYLRLQESLMDCSTINAIPRDPINSVCHSFFSLHPGILAQLLRPECKTLRPLSADRGHSFSPRYLTEVMGDVIRKWQGGNFIKYSKGPRLAKLPYGLGRLAATSQDAAVRTRTLSIPVNVHFSLQSKKREGLHRPCTVQL